MITNYHIFLLIYSARFPRNIGGEVETTLENNRVAAHQSGEGGPGVCGAA